MTQTHPITPPLELVEQWMTEAHDQPPGPDARVIATKAAQWGADQELDANCKWLAVESIEASQDLRTARRPEPPSLKEQALNTLDGMSDCMGAGFIPKRSDLDTIRRALEALND